MTVPVKIRSAGKTVQTYALFDTGAEMSFCELELTGLKKSVPIQPFSTTVRSEVVEGLQVHLVVSSVNDDFSLELNNVIAVEGLPFKSGMIPEQDELNSWGDYRGLRFPSVTNKSIGLLIGIDNRRAIMHLEYRYGPECGPDAIKSSFGWTICGPAMNRNDSEFQEFEAESMKV